MAERKHILSGAPWEQRMGYARAVRVGQTVEVSGTVAVRHGKIIGTTVEEQTECILEIIGEALEGAGSSLDEVVRTRIYLCDATRWEEVAAVHGRIFQNVRPACTLVEVSRLIDPAYLVEIEATAVLK